MAQDHVARKDFERNPVAAQRGGPDVVTFMSELKDEQLTGRRTLS